MKLDILIYNGTCGLTNLQMFTDMLTKSTFLVRPDEEIWQALDRIRKPFNMRPAIRPEEREGL
jgi:hypothetical protein